jgi:aminoglycoside phosphotransferase (APT) family kinase protein
MRARDVVQYLIDTAIIESSHILASEFEVVALPRRNNNFMVFNPAGESVMVKQAVSADRALTLAREAAAYRVLHHGGRPVSWLPRFHLYDDTQGVLVVGLHSEATTMKQRVKASGRVSRQTATQFGKALAAVHAQPASSRPAVVPETVRSGPPWILYLDCPDVSALETSSSAALEMIRIVQSSEQACVTLRECRHAWRSDCFTHGDLRWENCLVSTIGARASVCFVDWELSGRGDPAWDLGCLLAGYLRLWLDSIPISSESDIGPALDAARFPLTRVQPATRSFWSAYTADRRPNGEHADALVVRAAALAGAALLQSVFEEAQTSMVFSPHLAYRLQLAVNVMARPAEAVVHLLDLPLATAA